MEINLGELASLAEATELADAQSIKQALPITYVLDQANVSMEDTGGRVVAYCPFHSNGQESSPSLTVFGEDLERWSCMAGCTDRPGDVLDLIQRLAAEDGESISFVDACDRARGLVASMLEIGWKGTTKGRERVELDVERLSLTVEHAVRNESTELIDALISEKRRKDGQDSNRFTAEWLKKTFFLGEGPVYRNDFWSDEIIVPFFDRSGTLLTYKYRRPDTKLFALEGAGQFVDVYYNMWRTDRLDCPILLCEGESDTWNAQYEVGDAYQVLGIVTGVMTRPTDLELFKGRDVLIGFDGDDAGRKGMVRWAGYLKNAGCNVRIVPVPEGKDLSATAASLRHLCSLARPLVTAPGGLRADDTGYKRSNESAQPISNFVFKPTRELIGPDSMAWEGVILPGGEKALLASSDLRNKTAMVTWALKHKRAWYGSDRDVSILLGMLQADSTYLPLGHMANVAGLHNNHFVYPGGTIGPDPWTYVPPPADTLIEDDVYIRPGSWEPEYVHTLRDVHKHEITDPILAWLAIAPLRSLLKEFPILDVTGPHGSGKLQHVDEPILGPDGWYRIGDAKAGDRVATQDGTFTEIIGVFPQDDRRLYRIEFTDGSSTLAGPDHLWEVRRRSGGKTQKRTGTGLSAPYVKTTQELLEDSSRWAKWRIPLVEPVQHPERNLPIEPYMLGALLGDGSVSPTSRVTMSSDQAVSELFGPVQFRRGCWYASCSMPELEPLGLAGRRSWEKFVPPIYLFASVEQRKAVLAGLLDTDGSPTARGGVEFGTSSEQLANDVIALVQSLGGTAKLSTRIPWYTYKGERRDGRKQYRLAIRLTFNPFRLDRKAALHTNYTEYGPIRMIKAITQVADGETVCIKVADPSELYVTRDYIVTHNTRTLETLVMGMTGTYIAKTLTGTTPHIVLSSFAATNALPVIFEEYRPGARDDARTIFDQLARDAYTQQKSQKGGMKGNWAEATSIVPSAPVIVSGEDVFTEGSLIERMIMIQMYRDGQNPTAFAAANKWRNNGLPYAYLTWLHRSLIDGTLQNFHVTPVGPPDLGPRQRINIGTLYKGWQLLQQFMEDAQDSLGEPDFRMIVNELRDANSHTPIEDAVRWCMGEADAMGFVKLTSDGFVMIRIENFVTFIKERSKRGELSFVLPGKAPAVKKYLQLKFGAVEETDTSGNLTQTWVKFPIAKLSC